MKKEIIWNEIVHEQRSIFSGIKYFTGIKITRIKVCYLSNFYVMNYKYVSIKTPLFVLLVSLWKNIDDK